MVMSEDKITQAEKELDYIRTQDRERWNEFNNEKHEFTCPLGLGFIQRDPVRSGPDGPSYERAAIEEWLRQSDTNPLTRAPMAVADLQYKLSF